MNVLIADNADLKLAIQLTTFIDEVLMNFGEFVDVLKSQIIGDWQSQCQCGVIGEFEENEEMKEWQKSKTGFDVTLKNFKTLLNERINVANCGPLFKETPRFTFATDLFKQTKRSSWVVKKPISRIEKEEGKILSGGLCGIDGCTYTCKERRQMIVHKRRHTGERPHMCDQCDYRAASLKYLKCHKRTHCKDELQCEEEGCSYKTHNRNLLSYHRKKVHDPNNNYKCPWPDCKYNTPMRTLVDQHYRLHTGEKPFACPYEECDKHFPMKRYLTDHIKRNHEKDPLELQKYVCSWPGCNFATTSKHGLDGHMNAHSGIKPYKCDWPGCGSQFAHYSAMTKHKRRHTGEKKHSCSWPSCDKKFIDKDKLNDHMRIHTGDKPFKCPHPGCEYRAACSSNTRKHFKQVHGKSGLL